jgi:polyisoprenoid-binding protein YceI
MIAPSVAQVSARIAAGSLMGRRTRDPYRSSGGPKSKGVWGLRGITGAFTDVSGAGTIAPDGTTSGTVTITSDAVNTTNAKRDTHLTSQDFFAVRDYRHIVVTLNQPRVGGDTAPTEARPTDSPGDRT